MSDEPDAWGVGPGLLVAIAAPAATVAAPAAAATTAVATTATAVAATTATAASQHAVTRAIKRARFMALLPYVAD